MINLFKKYDDEVISSVVLVGDTTYQEAIEKFIPLVNRFESQRKILDAKFYERLERDILKGCMMPPITLAFVLDTVEIERISNDMGDLEQFINSHINEGYILDGLQRLNTLKRASAKEGFPWNKTILLNIIIAQNEDKLLYRMITLNNGQKQMSPRHQIEILTQELFNFEDFPNLDVQTEKERSLKAKPGSYVLADIAKGYLAFITNSVHIDNDKFIAEKMDQILVGKILDSDVTKSEIEFKQILQIIDKCQANDYLKNWFKLNNNIIAFCVGIKKSHRFISTINIEDLKNTIEKFEEAFKALNPSKVKLGKIRRDLVLLFISRLELLSKKSSEELIDLFIKETAQ